jgi:hypothetical protein
MRANVQKPSRSPKCAFDLYGRKTDAIAIAQDLIRRHGLAIDPDQVLIGFARTNFALEHVADRSSVGNLDVVCKTAVVVIDHEHFHGEPLSNVGKENKCRQNVSGYRAGEAK